MRLAPQFGIVIHVMMGGSGQHVAVHVMKIACRVPLIGSAIQTAKTVGMELTVATNVQLDVRRALHSHTAVPVTMDGTYIPLLATAVLLTVRHVHLALIAVNVTKDRMVVFVNLAVQIVGVMVCVTRQQDGVKIAVAMQDITEYIAQTRVQQIVLGMGPVCSIQENVFRVQMGNTGSSVSIHVQQGASHARALLNAHNVTQENMATHVHRHVQIVAEATHASSTVAYV